jgi:hypothetical protein
LGADQGAHIGRRLQAPILNKHPAPFYSKAHDACEGWHKNGNENQSLSSLKIPQPAVNQIKE